MALSGSEYIMFTVVNFVVWPGFAALYYFLVQRGEEDLMESMSEQAAAEASEG
jgi:hypothetical protein